MERISPITSVHSRPLQKSLKETVTGQTCSTEISPGLVLAVSSYAAVFNEMCAQYCPIQRERERERQSGILNSWVRAWYMAIDNGT
jgi:hypothetical protein